MHLIDQQLNLMLRGRFDEAWNLSELLEEQEPENIRHQFNRAWFYLNKGKFQEGSQMLEVGRFLSVYGNPKPNTTKPIYNQEPLEGKRVIINLEGGQGDQVIHSRFAQTIDSRGGYCIVSCEKPLHSIISRIKGVREVITSDKFNVTAHDYWIPGFSCGWVLGFDYNTLPNNPYISPIPEYVDRWKKIISSEKPKIGIRWSGNPKFEHQQFRIFPPEKLINLKKYTDLQFYSLQRDNDVMELPDEIIDLQHELKTWDDTAAAIENLDLVITSCTSIAHVSSAMGKPTWIVIPILPYHTWTYGTDHSPWYRNTTRIFRQTKFSNWDEPFERIEQSLEHRFNLTSKK